MWANRSEENKEFVQSLIGVLSDEKRSRLRDHLSLVKRAPWGGEKATSIGISATFALFVYGVEGLNALYEIATNDPVPTDKRDLPHFASFFSGHLKLCSPWYLLGAT
jgi:hypothetical protein